MGNVSFEDIKALVQQCHFSSCRHSGDVGGCALAEAIEGGSLNSTRLNNCNKMHKEPAYLSEKQDFKAAHIKKERVKKITHQFNKNKKRWWSNGAIRSVVGNLSIVFLYFYTDRMSVENVLKFKKLCDSVINGC